MSRQSDPVKVGVVGLGSFGQLHARTLAGIGEAQLVAVVARRQASLDEVARDLPGVPGWIDLEQALAESEAEAWVVATSTAAHVPITKKLLEAHKPVLLEKPVAENLEEAEALRPLIQDDSGNLMLGHIVLFNSEFRELCDELEQRSPIVYISAYRHRPLTLSKDYPGETPFHLTMVHDLYCALALTGRDEPVHFSAQTHHNDEGDCDLAVAQLQWEDSRIATFSAAFLTPAGMPPDGFDRLEVYGRGWAARLESNPRPIQIWDDKARWPMALEIRADSACPSGMLAEELRCFCRVVRGLEPVPVGATYHDAMQVQGWLSQLEAASRVSV